MEDDLKKATIDSLRGTIGPIPTVNPNVAKIGEKLASAKKYADQYYVKDNIPLLGGMTLGDFLLGQAPEEVERWGQGDYPFRNPNQVVKTGGNRADVWKTGRFLPTFDVAANVVAPLTGLGLATKGMKVGMSIEDVGDSAAKASALRQVKPAKPEPYKAPRNEMGFYSALDEAVGNIQSPRGTGEQYLKQLQKTPGVKAEEISYRGLDKFLRENPKTSVEDIKAHLEKNQVKLDQQTLQGKNEDFEAYDDFPHNFREGNRDGAIESLADDEFDYYMSDRGDEFKQDWMERNGFTDEDLLDDPNLQRQADEYAEETAREYAWESARENAEEIFEHELGYTVRGNANYGEWRVEDPRGRTVSFGDRDYFSDRDDAFNAAQNDALESGYIDMGSSEGVQYDSWKLNGADDSYRENLIYLPEGKGGSFDAPHFEGHSENLLMHNRLSDREADGKKMLFSEEMQSDWLQQGRNNGFRTPELTEQLNRLAVERKAASEQFDAAPTYEEQTQYKELIAKIDTEYDIANRQYRNSVADAPFKKTYHEFLAKKNLNDAVEGGYDRFAWSPGKIHAERYGMSKQVDDIRYYPLTNSLEAYKNKQHVLSKTLEKPEDLDMYLGKEFAQRLRETPSTTHPDSGTQYHFLEGEPVDIGDRRAAGMRNYYDEKVPNFLSSHLKKYGVKPGTTQVEGKDVHYVDITPEMREEFTKRGQPMFAAAPLAMPMMAPQMQEEEVPKPTPEEIAAALRMIP